MNEVFEVVDELLNLGLHVSRDAACAWKTCSPDFAEQG
jgi:hypothetical protein